MRRYSRQKEGPTKGRKDVNMCLTNLQTNMPCPPPDRSASRAPGGLAPVPGQERGGDSGGSRRGRAPPLDGDQKVEPVPLSHAPSSTSSWGRRATGRGLKGPGLGQLRDEGGAQGWVSERGGLQSRCDWRKAKAGAGQGRCPLQKHWGSPPRVWQGASVPWCCSAGPQRETRPGARSR